MLHDDLRSLMALAGCDRDAPLAASPLDAVLDAARAMADGGDRSWRLVPPAEGLATVVEACDLVPLGSDLLQDATLYVDRQPDRRGEHRVYARDEASLPGLPWFAFPTLPDAVAWMLAVSTDPEGFDVPAGEPDAWDQSPFSGGWVLERMLEEDLPGLWSGSRPLGGEPGRLDLADRTPGWQRRLCLGALRHVGATGRVPDLGPARGMLGAPARTFVEHLEDLARAIAARA